MELKDLTSSGSTIDRGLSIVIYSNPGQGKTTLSTTLDPETTLIINADAGEGPLIEYEKRTGKGHIVFPLLKYVLDNEYEKVIDDLYQKLRTEKHPFKNIVLDNISEMENQLILHLTQRHGKEAPTLREYGDAIFKMKQWIHDFRDLQYLGMNVIFNAWEFPMDLRNCEGSVITIVVPKVSKSLVPVLCGCVDAVGRMEVHEKSGKRWVRFRPNDQYMVKCQFAGIGGANDDAGELPDFSVIFGKIKEDKETN